jgi:CheY-like chemotaxis protein
MTMTSQLPLDSLLKGARILVVEDDWLISTLLADVLTDRGCEVVGPVSSVAGALVLAAGEAIDAALLDLNVKGEVSYPVARTLAERGIPFAFLTGYVAGKISETYRERPMLQKPFRVENLVQVLEEILDQTRKKARAL